MNIQKYRAKIRDKDTEVVGYIIEVRRYLGDGVYSDDTDHLICVTEKSMPDGGMHGTWIVDSSTIRPEPCGVRHCEECGMHIH